MSPIGLESRWLSVAGRTAHTGCTSLAPGRQRVCNTLALCCPHSALGCDSSSIFLPRFLLQNPDSLCSWLGLDARSLRWKIESFPPAFSNLSSRLLIPGDRAQTLGSCVCLRFPPSTLYRQSPPPTQPPQHQSPPAQAFRTSCQGEAQLTLSATPG